VLLETLLRDCGADKESKEQADPHECSLETPAACGNNETDSFSPLQTPLRQSETGSRFFCGASPISPDLWQNPEGYTPGQNRLRDLNY
jgi:hypothetical protein